MKFLKHLFIAKSNKNGSIHSSKPKSFSQRREESRKQSLEKAQEYRKKLVKQEYVSPEPLKSEFKRKGRTVDVQIRKLKKSQ